MKKAVIRQQEHYIAGLKKKTEIFLSNIDKSGIETILLSGSAARGDFWPGKFGGMIDLTVFKKQGSGITPEEIFGGNEEPEIPFHCVRRGNEWFQILFQDKMDAQVFRNSGEPAKSALMESVVLYDPEKRYEKTLAEIYEFAGEDLPMALANALGYINFLLSEYKTDRWERREAYPQLHQNLDSALREGIKSLYYLNGKYAPAEDRRLYYSYDLEKLPVNYEKLMKKLYRQNIASLKDYRRREKIFRKEFLGFIMYKAGADTAGDGPEGKTQSG
ncbi:hypothetical protein K7I13_13685 [Brucepastera parasyntrophica]|uniref:hypothetical protein n=1 Tax=Brucepastera parasyntrophica TaxID=2880008 RepID=UPI00210B11EA|nr:hypothetical protein [Brucepastera parasyntrophica]ULQ59504.1 hypothetical protein K7I13_13685 [Brucepastera parasyntrophica]